MRSIVVYLVRILVCGLGCAVVLRFCYGPATPYDEKRTTSYIVVSAILTTCALLGWLLSIRRSKALQAFSSAAIASAICILLIQASEWADYVVGMPWHYFYKDDYIAAFKLIAPITIAILSGCLVLIPKRRSH
jgi:hypothetical protein